MKKILLLAALALLAVACNQKQATNNSTPAANLSSQSAAGQSAQSNAQANQPTTQPKPDPATASWKTYTNTKYGFQFKYPPALFLSSYIAEAGNKNGADPIAAKLNGTSSILDGGSFLDLSLTSFASLAKSAATSPCNAPACQYQDDFSAQANYINQQPAGTTYTYSTANGTANGTANAKYVPIDAPTGSYVTIFGTTNGKIAKEIYLSPQSATWYSTFTAYNANDDKMVISLMLDPNVSTYAQAQADPNNKLIDQMIATFQFTSTK